MAQEFFYINYGFKGAAKFKALVVSLSLLLTLLFSASAGLNDRYINQTANLRQKSMKVALIKALWFHCMLLTRATTMKSLNGLRG